MIPRARFERVSRAILRQFRVAVVNIDPEGRQGLVDWKTAKNIAPTPKIATAVCDLAHRWVIYIGAFCVDDQGSRYIKAVEIAPNGIYRTDSLAGVLEEHYRALVKGCNPSHIIGSGWIANPGGASLDEEQAYRVFEACGAWEARLAEAG
ncbi:hypothetical protein [Stutzerimonas nitrititolerans]|uniref:hypothetical protein n=1 Tax=Stutzerimonas nitrititolerans TaxID=2482751 RepID=UPI00289DAA2D|nr:hypothetical protein [Stutzerimonas nitrititolerans]